MRESCPGCGRAPVIKTVRLVAGSSGKPLGPPMYRIVCPEHEFDPNFSTGPFETVEKATAAWNGRCFIGAGAVRWQ